MFKIYDGREKFYQWDLDRKLIVEDPSVTEVHFCNRTDSCSLVCETFVEDGVTLVNVPNLLLTTDWRIHVYAYDGKHTKHDTCYEVVSRTKPSDYIYTETEVLSYEVLEKRVKELEEANDGNTFVVNITHDYMLGSISADKSFDEIQEAIKNGKTIKAYVINHDNYKRELLSDITEVSAEFTTFNPMGSAKYYCTEENEWYFTSSIFEQEEYKTNTINPSSGIKTVEYPTVKAVIDYVGECLGSVEDAVNEIIAIQESLMGVSE